MKIEIDLDLDRYLARFEGYGRDGDEVSHPTTIEDVVIGEVSRQLLSRIFGDPFTGAVSKRVSEIRDSEIRERVIPLVEEAIAGPVTPTNTFGEARAGAESTTLREEIVRIANEYLTKPGGDSFSSRGRQTVLQAFIEGEVKRVVDKELREALDAAKAEVAAAVREKGAEVLTKTIASLGGVKL